MSSLADKLKVAKVVQEDVENGSEYPRYKLIVDESERAYILELLNPDTAYRDVADNIPDYLGDYTEECGLPPGLYNCIIKIDGAGPDICGEYDSWLVFDDIKVYELKEENLVPFEYDTVEQG